MTLLCTHTRMREGWLLPCSLDQHVSHGAMPLPCLTLGSLPGCGRTSRAWPTSKSPDNSGLFTKVFALLP
jgi:hypothetical protein